MIDQYRLSKIIRTLIKAEKKLGTPLRKEARVLNSKCPIISFLPDKDSSGRPYKYVLGTFYGDLPCQFYSMRDSIWWSNIDPYTKDEYLTEIKKWLNTRYKGKLYKYLSIVNGELQSTYQEDGKHYVEGARVLKYVPNLVKYAPKNSVGIFLLDSLYPTKDIALRSASASERYPIVVYEVETLDKINKVSYDDILKLGIEDTCGVGYYTCNKIRLTKLVRKY